VTQDEVRQAVEQALMTGERDDVATAVRQSLDWFAQQHPGRAVEVRVPPFRVVQVLGGTTHRRGTPPAVVEMRPQVWLDLVTGRMTWTDAVTARAISASGERSDLSDLLPAL
jgi:hypothetical protein